MIFLEFTLEMPNQFRRYKSPRYQMEIRKYSMLSFVSSNQIFENEFIQIQDTNENLEGKTNKIDDGYHPRLIHFPIGMPKK